jgi:hypothetical protein
MMKKLDREKKKHAQPWLSIPVQFKHSSLRGIKKINFNTCFEDGSLIKVDKPECLVLLCRNSHLIPESFIWKRFFKSLNKTIGAEVNPKEWRLRKTLLQKLLGT